MDEKVKIKDLIKILKKRFLIILLTTLCITGFIIISTLYIMKPTYQYSTQVLAGSLSLDNVAINQVQENRQLALSYMDTIKSPHIMIGVKRELKLPRSNYELLKQVSVTNRDSSQIVTISVKDSNPKLAKSIALSAAKQSIDKFKNFANVNQITIMNSSNGIEEAELLFPKPKFVISISIVIGLFAGIACALLREHFDDAAFGDCEIDHLGLTLLGRVKLKTKRNKKKRKTRYKALSQANTVDTLTDKRKHSFKPNDANIKEQFYTICNNIDSNLAKEGSPLLMVTSLAQSQIIANTTAYLALAYSDQRKRVLVVDTNLREPSLHNVFNIDNSLGLITSLLGEEEQHQQQDTLIKITDYLFALPTGDIIYEPSTLLILNTFPNLIEQWKQDFDIILFHTSESLDTPDAQIVAKHCDGIVLAIKEGRDKLEKIVNVKKQFEHSKQEITGTIIIS
jgi:capsular exopolysaccharide synthesis family protein